MLTLTALYHNTLGDISPGLNLVCLYICMSVWVKITQSKYAINAHKCTINAIILTYISMSMSGGSHESIHVI